MQFRSPSQKLLFVTYGFVRLKRYRITPPPNQILVQLHEVNVCCTLNCFTNNGKNLIDLKKAVSNIWLIEGECKYLSKPIPDR